MKCHRPWGILGSYPAELGSFLKSGLATFPKGTHHDDG